VGISERRERDKERRRAEIIEAAERVFFCKGVDNATMDDVAEAAELSKGTLYLYFKNKEDLYLAIIVRGITILQRAFEEAAKARKKGIDKVAAIGRAYFDFCKTHAQYFSAMLYFESYNLDPGADSGYGVQCTNQTNRTFAICEEAVQFGIDDGTIRPDIDPKKTALTLYGLATGLLQIISIKGKLIRQDHHVNPDELIDTFFDLIAKSLRP